MYRVWNRFWILLSRRFTTGSLDRVSFAYSQSHAAGPTPKTDCRYAFEGSATAVISSLVLCRES